MIKYVKGLSLPSKDTMSLIACGLILLFTVGLIAAFIWLVIAAFDIAVMAIVNHVGLTYFQAGAYLILSAVFLTVRKGITCRWDGRLISIAVIIEILNAFVWYWAPTDFFRNNGDLGKAGVASSGRVISCRAYYRDVQQKVKPIFPMCI